jgi:hypothetical protein
LFGFSLKTLSPDARGVEYQVNMARVEGGLLSRLKDTGVIQMAATTASAESALVSQPRLSKYCSTAGNAGNDNALLELRGRKSGRAEVL